VRPLERQLSNKTAEHSAGSKRDNHAHVLSIVVSEMVWLWRKFYQFGPLRATLSNRGLGWSLGFRFLRYGIGPGGTRYLSIGIPGTGLYFTRLLGRGVPLHFPSLPLQKGNSGPTTQTSQQQLTANQKILDALKNKRP
jgi:hypothetical protein